MQLTNHDSIREDTPQGVSLGLKFLNNNLMNKLEEREWRGSSSQTIKNMISPWV